LFATHYRDDIDFKETNLLTTKNLLEKILISSTKTSEKTDVQLVKQIDEFFKSLDDDLNSSKAIEIFENICTSVIGGNSISGNDFDRICWVLGIEL